MFDCGIDPTGQIQPIGRLRKQVRHGVNRRDFIADADPEHLPDIRGRIGAHKQHAAAGFSELDRRRACDRGFPNAAFAREKESAEPVQEISYRPFSSRTAAELLAPSAWSSFSSFQD